MVCDCFSVLGFGFLLLVVLFVFKQWCIAKALQAVLLSFKHLDLDICFLSKSEKIAYLKSQGT